MERKRLLLIILGVIAVSSLLICLTIFTMMNSNRSNDDTITKITLCDMDARDLCVVTFGTDQNNQMLIHFQLPTAGYPAFHVKGFNKGRENLYTCGIAKDEPTSVYCTGTRTPLGEQITLEVYDSENDQLLAHGNVMVSALFIITKPIELIATPEGVATSESTATAGSTTVTPLAVTPTPDTAYPNP